jgi:hypothetical protein
MIKTVLKIVPLLLLAGCVGVPYVEPTQGPLANVRVPSDHRNTDAWMSTDGCSGHPVVPYDTWVAVPAHRRVSFHKNYPVGMSICNARGSIQLSPGDRATVRFHAALAGLSMTCGMTAAATDASGQSSRLLPVGRSCTAE